MSESGHDARGRFAPGNAGGPGRPRRETEKEYLVATFANVSPAEWGKIVSKAVKQALKGDHRARLFLAEHVLPERPKIPPMDLLCELYGTTPQELSERMQQLRDITTKGTDAA